LFYYHVGELIFYGYPDERIPLLDNETIVKERNGMIAVQPKYCGYGSRDKLGNEWNGRFSGEFDPHCLYNLQYLDHSI